MTELLYFLEWPLSMLVYVWEAGVAEGPEGAASQIAMVEDHRAFAGKQKKKENFSK